MPRFITLGSAIPMLVGVVLLLVGVTAQGQLSAPQQSYSQPSVFPLTTKVPEARRLTEEALTLYVDHVEQPAAIKILRRVVKIDPDFAMAHEFLAQISLDSAEQVGEQARAFATRKHANQSEQRIIEWYQDAADHKLISAITKMNSTLGQYPHDKWVVWMVTWWLLLQNQYEHSIAVYESSGIADSPGLMNNTAYNYAYVRQFDKAFALMEKYVAALPQDPNPQDSYAEILRMAGYFDQAIEHYRASLAIKPDFYSSQFGIADTYSLMGDQVRARKEYESAFQKFSVPEQHWTLWKTRQAITYVREGDYAGANRAFQLIADYAHSRHLSQVEADIYRQMAMYQQRPKRTLDFLSRAELSLREGKNALKIMMTQESAQILRLRIETSLKMGKPEMARRSLARLLETMKNSNDRVIELAYHGAAGALLYSEHRYDEAISHLEEDTNNPLSLRLLTDAYQANGATSEAVHTSETLANLNDPTLEQALVVQEFRKCFQDVRCGSSIKNTSFTLHHPL